MLEEKAKWVRQKTLEMITRAQKGHIGGSLSCVDILVALYYSIMEKGDKFILSKGHACAPLYAILADKGYFPIEELNTFNQTGSKLEGHPHIGIPGIDVNTGSLGQGLGIGCGLAMTTDKRVYVLMGDGECQEGSVWEAALFASEHKLGNLIGIIDYNRLGATRDTSNLHPLISKWEAFGWQVIEIFGHSFSELNSALKWYPSDQPLMVIAHTIKGKGVPYMENKVEWHHKVPND